MKQREIDAINWWVAIQSLKHGDAFRFEGIPDDGSLKILAHPDGITEVPSGLDADALEAELNALIEQRMNGNAQV